MSAPHDLNSATTLPSTTGRPRILLFGIRCAFTAVVARTLDSANASIIGVILPGPPELATPLPFVSPRSSLPMAGNVTGVSIPGQLSAYHVGQLRSDETRQLVSALKPDIIVVACFPRRIPKSIIRLAPFGALNIHPSALPENRGPDPLFWAFKRGDGRFGVSVHELSQHLDAGGIVGQRSFDSWHGVAEADVERTLARHGANLALRAVNQRSAGYKPKSQDERQATYESWPESGHYLIDSSRPARDAYNFVRGVRERGVPIRVAISGNDAKVLEVVSFRDNSNHQATGSGMVSIPCSPGTLVARIQRDG